ncbi:MAG: xanthine dehydrogenase family protein molybdopterin-binding subunit, partial [Pseudomonadota bacterium]
PYAHAELLAVDAEAARGARGVRAVFTAADAGALGLAPLANRSPLAASADGAPVAPVTMAPLAEGAVRFVGQPIAMVVADSAADARDALDLIALEVEERPAVADGRAALAPGAPQLHPEAPGNQAFRWETGDAAAVAAAFAGAAHRVALEVRNQRVVVNALEPRAVNAVYDPTDGRFTLHLTTQGSFNLRLRLSELMGVPEDRIRVVTPDVGGGFGMKLMVHPEYAVVAAAAKALGAPVKWTADRTESFLSDAQGRDLASEAEAAFDAEGRILAARARSVSNLGAYYSQFGAGIHTLFSANLIGSMYRVPAVWTEVRGAFTNTTPTDAYRGAGRPEICYVIERLMDAAARRIGIAPEEIRRRNLLSRADMPYAAAGGARFDSGDCRAMLEAALAAADPEGRAARRAEAAARGRVLGLGVAYYMERTGGAPFENARLRVGGDGRVQAWVGTQSTGQGHETAWSQVIAARLGVDPERIDFPHGDSDALPGGAGTGGSRSTIMAHRTFGLAAEEVIAQGRRVAADALEAAEADIEFAPEDGGRFRVAGTDRAIDLFAAAAAAERLLGAAEIVGAGGVTDREPTFPNGAHVVEVELDPETGALETTRYTIVDDFGAILNPLLAEGQVHGGVAQGLGQALMEAAVSDPETGQPLAGSFMDYAMPRADDMPFLSSRFDESAPTPTNPMGVKGCGEAGAVGATPAVALAALDALSRAGAADVDALHMPLTPSAVWAALEAARRAA